MATCLVLVLTIDFLGDVSAFGNLSFLSDCVREHRRNPVRAWQVGAFCHLGSEGAWAKEAVGRKAKAAEEKAGRCQQTGGQG